LSHPASADRTTTPRRVAASSPDATSFFMVGGRVVHRRAHDSCFLGTLHWQVQHDPEGTQNPPAHASSHPEQEKLLPLQAPPSGVGRFPPPSSPPWLASRPREASDAIGMGTQTLSVTDALPTESLVHTYPVSHPWLVPAGSQ
jgi:hypothetical protein